MIRKNIIETENKTTACCLADCINGNSSFKEKQKTPKGQDKTNPYNIKQTLKDSPQTNK
jgi:hypothetical protein